MSESLPTDPAATVDKAEQRSNIKRHSLWLLAAAIGFYVTYFIYMIVYTSGH